MPNNTHSKRTSDVDLPAGNEIMHISNAEEKRVLLPDNEHVHYPVFDTIIRIFNHWNLDPYIFTTPDLKAEEILDTGRKQIEQLTDILLVEKQTGEEIALLDDAYSYLSEDDEPEKSDYIFVFGSKTPLRAEKAVELFKTGLAPKMILSGRGPFYGDENEMTEAEKYAAIALRSGIPEEDIIIEDASITTPDNVRRTLNMLDAKHIPYNSFIVVNSPYTQRRGWCSWRKHLPKNIPIYRVNSETGPNFTRDAWYKNSDGLKVVLGEFVGLRNTIAFNDA